LLTRATPVPTRGLPALQRPVTPALPTPSAPMRPDAQTSRAGCPGPRTTAPKRVTTECGGKTPQIVTADAPDLDTAAQYAVNDIYGNQGEVCNAGSRILVVHSAVAADFVDRLVEKTKAVKYGDPLDPATDMGTVIDEAAAKLFQARVDEAIAQGARLLAGPPREGALYAPTVIDRVRPEMIRLLQVAKKNELKIVIAYLQLYLLFLLQFVKVEFGFACL